MALRKNEKKWIINIAKKKNKTKKPEQSEKKNLANQISIDYEQGRKLSLEYYSRQKHLMMQWFSNILVSGTFNTKKLLRIAESFCLHELYVSIFNKL